ncbi:hypothetical protein RAK27_02975 [Carnobacterium maltaromaticum]|uniref:Uncharacterized protein n=1 Tax=Carnobacterium maltaromaticum TaxID=2751 RepID=A0AAW9JPU7_CARML|nr:hypothetical protein [Carnobacterium maltaromaticum]
MTSNFTKVMSVFFFYYSFYPNLIVDFKSLANSIKFMYDLPQEVAIRELTIAATKQNA